MELHRLVLTWAVWTLVVLGGLHLLSTFTLETLYVLSYLGFLLAVHLFAPTDPAPVWWRWIQLVVLLGFLGLCYFVAARAVEVVGI